MTDIACRLAESSFRSFACAGRSGAAAAVSPRVRLQKRGIGPVTNVDYAAAAGLYPCKTVRRTSKLRYKRFESVAEALRFAIEDMPSSMLRGCVLEVDEDRFDGMQMQKLYEADGYPFPRRGPSGRQRR